MVFVFINTFDLDIISKLYFKRKLINYIDINNFIDWSMLLVYFIELLLIFF